MSTVKPVHRPLPPHSANHTSSRNATTARVEHFTKRDRPGRVLTTIVWFSDFQAVPLLKVHREPWFVEMLTNSKNLSLQAGILQKYLAVNLTSNPRRLSASAIFLTKIQFVVLKILEDLSQHQVWSSCVYPLVETTLTSTMNRLKPVQRRRTAT